MLSQLQKLSVETDGRFATDEELQFVNQYARSFGLRLQTYQKLQAAEAVIVQQVYVGLQALDPTLFQGQPNDLSAKWKRDTIRVLRYSAIAMLLDDPTTLQERLLFWFQSIMKAFGAQRSCHLTYTAMQAVVKQHLTPVQASLFCPILEINRKLLGSK
ncbi:phycobilisome protein [Pantanalinema sp. GBBB05]|uniref:phycobilisome protein n=1 Tax=Pantanalinema sp. GBBB05 TaxID=2604139 RepID=UPI001D1E4783|nr:phycobilisome protein [Pantanalinema sp. GBBB05]